MKKRASSLLLATCMALSLVSTPNVQAASKKKTTLSSKTVTMKVGQKKTLKLKNYKKISKKAIKKVKWTSSNKKVVTVKYRGKYRQEGKLTAKKEGVSYIKVKFNGKTYKCKVTVKAKDVPTTESKTTEKVTTEAKTTESVTSDRVTTEVNTEKPTHVHEWSDWKVSKEVTCVEDGIEERKCSSCSKVEQRVVKASGHEYEEFTQNATCEEDGIITRTCSKCGNVENKVIKAKGHKWDNGIIKQEATYTSPGVKEYTCTVCGKTKEESTPMLNETEHNWNEGIITTQPTCILVGVKTYTCKNCGGTKTENIPPIGHDYDEGTITKAATCKENGIKTYTCRNCGNTKTETISNESIDHTWNEPIIIENSTCAKKGTESYTCSVCGEMKTESLPLSTTHKWGSWVTTKAATCGESGTKTRTCSLCKITKTMEIEATGNHTYDDGIITVAPTCATQGVKTYTCTVCGNKKTEAVAKTTTHTYDEGVVTTEPTCGKPGVRTYTCTVCKKTKTETIKATGNHSYIVKEVEQPTFSDVGYSMKVCSDCGRSLYDSICNYTAGLDEPTSITKAYTKPDDVEQVPQNYYSIMGSNYLLLIPYSGMVIYMRAIDENKTYDYKTVLITYRQKTSEIEFRVYAGELSSSEFASANPELNKTVSIADLKSLFEDSKFDGLYCADATWEKLPNGMPAEYGLKRSEIPECLNKNDIYIATDYGYISPQGVWAFLRDNDILYNGHDYEANRIPNNDWIYRLK